MKKFLMFLILMLLIVGGAAWYFASFRLDLMIEEKIEQTGTASFGAPVSVGAVQTNIRDGSLRIADITVANPAGFRNKNAFTLSGIEAAVDFKTFDIKRVYISEPHIVVEEKGGSTNFDEMMKRLNQGEEVPVEVPEGEEERVITIRHFLMNESRAAFESESLDRYSDIKIDEVELKNLSGTPSELSSIIASEVLKEITKEAAMEILKAQAGKKYDEVEKSVTDKLKGMLGSEDDSGG